MPRLASLPLYLMLAVAWAALIRTVAEHLASGGLWVIVTGVLVLGVPVALAGAYAGAIEQIRRLQLFARRGWLFRVLSGRVLRTVAAVAWALVTALPMLLQFHGYDALEWTIVGLVVPLFWLVWAASRSLMAGELRGYLVTHLALRSARLLTPLLMVGLYLALMPALGQAPSHPSLSAAVAAQQTELAELRGSALVREAAHYLAFYEGVKAYALGRLGDTDALWAAAIVAAGSWVVFYNACAILSCFLIPRREYRRLFAPPSDSDEPPRVPPRRAAMLTAVTTFLVLFVYVPLFAYLEAWIQQHPRLVAAGHAAERELVRELERIEEAYYEPGTLARIELARSRVLAGAEAAVAALSDEADRAFDRVVANVDVYLDWYYSLGGEYGRIAHLLTGELERYMLTKLEEALQRGEPFASFEARFAEALDAHAEARREYERAVGEIMAQRRVEPGETPVRVVRQMSLEQVLTPPAHEDMIDFGDRLLAGGAGAAIASIATALIVEKLAGKKLFQLAAKSLGKVVLGKSAGSGLGAGAGATAGATLGSVVPGVGTAIGAVVGGIAGGIAAGVAVDKALIELEEAVNRDAFRQEIVAAIEEARREFLTELDPGRSTASAERRSTDAAERN